MPPARTAPGVWDNRNSQTLYLDRLLSKLLEARNSRPGKSLRLSENDIRCLLTKSWQVLLSQPSLLEIQAPVKILGDIHGQFHDLLRHFEVGGFPPDANYLLLGDYVDRGNRGIETMCLLLAYKVKYPENIFLLRGNHECASLNRVYGFYDECKRRFNIRLWKQFCDVFDCLPPAALVSDRILCMHGGLSPSLGSFDEIRQIHRPTDIPDFGLMCDLLWADPDPDILSWAQNERGVSFLFGPNVVASFNHRHDLDLIVRAHQVVEDGYEFFAEQRLVTLFSAPHYCGEFDNVGGLLDVEANLHCSFKLLEQWQPGSRRALARLAKAVLPSNLQG